MSDSRDLRVRFYVLTYIRYYLGGFIKKIICALIMSNFIYDSNYDVTFNSNVETVRRIQIKVRNLLFLALDCKPHLLKST